MEMVERMEDKQTVVELVNFIVNSINDSLPRKKRKLDTSMSSSCYCPKKRNPVNLKCTNVESKKFVQSILKYQHTQEFEKSDSDSNWERIRSEISYGFFYPRWIRQVLNMLFLTNMVCFILVLGNKEKSFFIEVIGRKVEIGYDEKEVLVTKISLSIDDLNKVLWGFLGHMESEFKTSEQFIKLEMVWRNIGKPSWFKQTSYQPSSNFFDGHIIDLEILYRNSINKLKYSSQ